MSEQGSIDFLHVKGVDGWVVLHGGATSVFRIGSLSEAADVAAAIAEVPGLEAAGALLTIALDRLTVRLTRGILQLEPTHVGLARAVSAVARSRGVAADRGAVQELQLAMAATPDDIDVGFWRAVLGYDPRADDNAVDPLGDGSTVPGASSSLADELVLRLTRTRPRALDDIRSTSTRVAELTTRQVPHCGRQDRGG